MRYETLSDTSFSKENLDIYLKELGKEFRKLNGTKIPAEIILVGGASIVANYDFREMTYDIDALYMTSSAMKDAINNVGDRHKLPPGWLNMDFKSTSSYTPKLREISNYYKTFSNILTVRTVSAEYLIAMKAMSGRQYKNDLSDIVGILWEHQKHGKSITRESIDNAILMLYGDAVPIPDTSKKLLDDVFAKGDFEKIYKEVRQEGIKSKNTLLDFNKAHPNELKSENINVILDEAKRLKQEKENKSKAKQAEDKFGHIEK